MTAQAVVVRGTKIASRVIGKGTPGAKGDPGGNVMAIGLFTAASTITVPSGTNAVRTSGYSTSGVGIADYIYDATINSTYVAANPRTSFLDAAGRGFRLVWNGYFNVKWLGAQGDSNATGSTGTDDTTAIQAAINFINALGGGSLYFPEGYYKISTYLTICKNLRIIGASRHGATIVQTAVGGGGANAGQNVRNGTVFYSNWPSNSATQVNFRVEHLGITSAAASSQGAGVYDNCGAYLNVHDCRFIGLHYHVVFDQTECSDVTECDFEAVTTGGACFYAVNGASLTPGNLNVVTNRISVSRCQFNPAGASNYCVLDEGGYTHSYVANNYNGGLCHIYAAGCQALEILGGEFEASVGPNIVLEYRKLDGTGVGGSLGRIQGILASNTTNAIINIVSTSGPFLIAGNWMSRSDNNPPIMGGANANELALLGNYTGSTSGELVDSTNSYFYRDSRVDLPVRSTSATSFTADRSYVNRLVQCTNASGCAVTIPPDSAGGVQVVPIGAAYFLEQDAASNHASLVAGSGVTITGPLATTKQYQTLVVRKVAANTWKAYRRATAPDTGWTADTGTAAKGANATYAAGTTLTYSATYTQAEQTAMATRMAAVEAAVQANSQTIKAIKDALISGGIIGA